MLHLDTISPAMRAVATMIHTRLNAAYYLAGGTALALRIGHRESVDLDYFIAEPIDTARLKRTLLDVFPDVVFTYEDVDTLWCSVSGIKVSFITRRVPCLEPAEETDGFRMATLADLTLMKLSAVSNRDEYKDYYDLAALARMTDARSWPALWGKVHPESDPIAWIVALSHVGEIDEIPLRGKNIQTKQAVVEELQRVVRELSPFVNR